MKTIPIEQIIDDRLRDYQLDIHTSIPGYVKSYDPETKTAEIVVAYSDFFASDAEQPTNLDWVPIPDVPVIFPRGGGWAITWPLTEGDPVLLVFSERSIDEWFASDGKSEVAPQYQGTHDEADCFCLPGLWPSKNKEGKADSENMHIGKEETRVSINKDATVDIVCSRLNIGAEGASVPVARGDRSQSHFGTLASKINEIITICSGTGGLLIPPPAPIGALSNVESGKAFTND